MCAFELYTNRARRVVVFFDQEARRNADEQITNAHVLIALARDAVTPWPDTPGGRGDRMPLREPFSLALRVLEEFDITVEDLVEETCRIAGLVKPRSLLEFGPSAEGAQAPRLGPERHRAAAFEILAARRHHDNHLSTLHQLLGLANARRGAPARQILASLGIPRSSAIKRAAHVVDDERKQLQRQMDLFALENPALRKELARIIPGSTSGLWWRRKKLRRSLGDPAA